MSSWLFCTYSIKNVEGNSIVASPKLGRTHYYVDNVSNSPDLIVLLPHGTDFAEVEKQLEFVRDTKRDLTVLFYDQLYDVLFEKLYTEFSLVLKPGQSHIAALVGKDEERIKEEIINSTDQDVNADQVRLGSWFTAIDVSEDESLIRKAFDSEEWEQVLTHVQNIDKKTDCLPKLSGTIHYMNAISQLKQGCNDVTVNQVYRRHFERVQEMCSDSEIVQLIIEIAECLYSINPRRYINQIFQLVELTKQYEKTKVQIKRIKEIYTLIGRSG